LLIKSFAFVITTLLWCSCAFNS